MVRLAIFLSLAVALTAPKSTSAQQFSSPFVQPTTMADEPPFAPQTTNAQPLPTGTFSGSILPSGAANAASAQPSATASQPSSSFYLQIVGPHWWVAPRGTTLNVVMSTPVTSETAQFGDDVQAILNTNLYAGTKLIAAKGALVSGTVSVVDHARNDFKAKVSDYHWLNSDGGIGLQFKTIRLANGKELAIAAEPTPLSNIIHAEQTADPLIVDKNGEITLKGSTKGDMATNLAIDALSFVATPVGAIAISGIAGAAKPSLALSQGDILRSNHSRFKGFFVGAVNGIPGVGIARSIIGHGSHVALDTGDGITLTLEEDLTYKTTK